METMPEVVCGIRVMVSSHRGHMSRATVAIGHSQRSVGLNQRQPANPLDSAKEHWDVGV
jgi:hypothetical protein